MTAETLKDTARVKISQETLKQTIKSTLDPKRKRELQTEAMLNLIRNRPAGSRIKLADFQKAAFLKSDTNAHDRLKVLIKNGIIARYNLSPQTYSYSVIADAKVKQSLTIKAEATPQPKEIDNDKLKSANHVFDAPRQPYPVINVLPKGMTLVELKEQAMKFSWAHQENNNDLRAFIKWLEEKN